MMETDFFKNQVITQMFGFTIPKLQFNFHLYTLNTEIIKLLTKYTLPTFTNLVKIISIPNFYDPQIFK